MNRSFFSSPGFRAFAVSVALSCVSAVSSAQGRSLPGFGEITPLQGNWYYSQYGILNFPSIDSDPGLAWSSTLNDWLRVNNGVVTGSLYGPLTLGDTPGYVASPIFGWMHFRSDDAYGGMIWTERTGWTDVVTNGNGSFLWTKKLQGWGFLTPEGQYFSYDYGLLFPTENPILFDSPVFGRVTVGYPFDGWIWSEQLGGLLAAQGSGGTLFWSQLREDWLGLNPEGRLYSYNDQAFLPPAAGAEGGGDGAPADFNLDNVRWLHTNVSNWPITAELRSVTFPGGQICMDYVLSNRWPNITVGAVVNANPWIITKVNGTYYAGTWEWLRPGQTCKPKSVVNGAHVQRAPLNGRWSPRSGETVGIFVSAPARFGQSTVAERSNIVWVEWP